MLQNLFNWNSFGQTFERFFRVEFVDESVSDQNGSVGAFGKSVGLRKKAEIFDLTKLFNIFEE